MKRIAIAQRLVPYSRQPGTAMVIPGTDQVVRIFPTRIESDDSVVQIKVGPVRDFAVFQDLERGEIRVRGATDSGPLRFALTPNLETKHPVEGKLPHLAQRKPKLARLSFGSHKKLKWERIVERCDPAQFLPLWFALGQWMEPSSDELVGEWVDLFRARFSGFLLPCAGDPHHWGIDLPDSPHLLSSGAQRIRRSIVSDDLAIRPLYHSGRLTGLGIHNLEIDLEWSNHKLRRMWLRSAVDQEIALQLTLRRFRLDGKMVDASAPFALSQGEKVWLDRFEN